MSSFIIGSTYTDDHKQLHPTLKEAEHLIRRTSSLDRQEMNRIARMERSRDVFSESWVWTTKYNDRWKEWREVRGQNAGLVFSDEE